MTRPDAATAPGGSSPAPFRAGPQPHSGKWLPPGVPAPIRVISRLGLSPGRIVICALLALLLHIPLLPFARLITLGIFDFLGDETEEEGEAIVPIEIEIEGSTEEAPAAPKQEVTEVATPDPEGYAVADAGVDASKGVDDGGVDGGEQKTDAGPDAGPDAPPPPSKEPLADNKAVKDLTKNPNNVQIILVGSRLREHPVGARLGALLPTLKQWEPFFKGSGINPIDDVDAMVITGPQVRLSGEIVAIMKFNIDMARVEETIQKLAEGSEGEKLENTPVPAWKATADKGARVFATVPAKGLLYVLPWPKRGKKEKALTDEEWKKEERRRVDAQLARIKVAKFPDYTKETYAIDAYMIEPYKLVSKTGEIKLGPIEIQLIPSTLESMRIHVVPSGGDAEVTITFNAKDADDASSAMSDLRSAWPLFQLGAKSEVGMELPDLTWEQKGASIEAKATLPQASLDKVYELGKKHAEDVKTRKKD